MKLFRFYQRSYGDGFAVIAENRELALTKLIAWMYIQVKQNSHDWYRDWKRATIDKLPKGYKVTIVKSGVVITEICG